MHLSFPISTPRLMPMLVSMISMAVNIAHGQQTYTPYSTISAEAKVPKNIFKFPGTIVGSSDNPYFVPMDSPTIVNMGAGKLLAACWWGGDENTTGKQLSKRLYCDATIYRSTNSGNTWSEVGRVPNAKFPKLFKVGDRAYLLFRSATNPRQICISCGDFGESTPEYDSWDAGTVIVDSPAVVGCGSTSVISHNGYLWKADAGTHGQIMYRPDPSLTKSGNDLDVEMRKSGQWILTARRSFSPNDAEWLNSCWETPDNKYRPDWSEGNVVLGKDGKLTALLRVEGIMYSGSPGGRTDSQIKADYYDLKSPGSFFSAAEMNGKSRWQLAGKLSLAVANTIPTTPVATSYLPGGNNSRLVNLSYQNKITVLKDPLPDSQLQTFSPSVGVTLQKRYWAIVNKKTAPHYSLKGREDSDYRPQHQRNVLLLVYSDDLETWYEQSVLFQWSTGVILHGYDKIGCHSVDFDFDWDDIVYVARSAFGGGDRYHNANFMTFHRITNFRTNKDIADDIARNYSANAEGQSVYRNLPVEP